MIIALDLGTSTGVAYRDGDSCDVETWLLKGCTGEKGIALGRKLRDAIEEKKPDLLVFEDPVFIPNSRASVALRFGLEMIVQVVCEQQGITYTALNVTSVRKHLLGPGQWRKDDVIAEVRRRTGRQLTPDACDAWAASLLAAVPGMVTV